MIGRRKLCQQAITSMCKKALPLVEKQGKVMACVHRDFGVAPETPKPVPTKADPPTEGYYKDRADLKKRFEMKDPYYDPYLPYVWIHVLPRSWQPYLRFCRIDQNFGRMLVVNPHLWGIAIASPLGGLPDLLNLTLFWSGSIYAHAASCAFDDLADVSVDAVNPRCAYRPLVAKTMSKKAGLGIITALVAGSYGIWALLTPTAMKVGLLATPLIMAYPYTKRIFQYPQVFLAFVLNLGVFMGYGAVANFISWPICAAMYVGGIAHTVSYDSILAFQDIEADRKAGAYSSSQKFLKHAKAFNAGLGTITLGMHVLAGYFACLHPIYLPILGLGAAHLIWQTLKLDPTKPALCDHLFNVSYRYGIIVLIAYMMGVYFAKGKRNKVEAEIDERKKLEKEQGLKDDLNSSATK